MVPAAVIPCVTVSPSVWTAPIDFRQPEIEQLHAVRGHQNIRGFQIAVDDPSAVRRIQGGGNLSGQPDGFARRDGAGQRLALDKLHRQIIWPDFVDLANVRVIERGNTRGLRARSARWRTGAVRRLPRGET